MSELLKIIGILLELADKIDLDELIKLINRILNLIDKMSESNT